MYGKNEKKKREARKRRIGINTIKVKLIGSFFIPVLFIILLGMLCYNKALEGIVSHYEAAVKDSIKATSGYFDLGFKSIEGTVTGLAVDDNLTDPNEYGAYKGVQKSIIAKLAADELISNIHLFL